MSQLFHRSINTISLLSIVGGGLLLAGIGAGLWLFVRSPYTTQVNVPKQQPIPFSHKHHVQGLGIDCRYCHVSVEQSSFAGIPPTATCLGCHAIVWKEAPLLKPLHDAAASGQPIEWTRVHDLPDFVYFDHSIHVAKGVGCVACHGQVNEMPLVRKTNTLQMSWCLSCHRHPEPFLRPKDKVTDAQWEPSEDAQLLGKTLVEKYRVENVTNCSACHR